MNPLLSLLILVAIACSTDVYVLSNWVFTNDSRTFKANVPGFIHLDLYNNDLIPDPFYGINEKAVSWVENSDWQYTSQFTVDQAMLDNDNIEIVFDGLDTYANVYLNTKLILTTDNMFKQWRVSIKDALLPKNILMVDFKSPVKVAESKVDKTYCGIALDNRTRCQSFVRKAPYHFGWDWGPILITTGIWRQARIEGFDNLRIEFPTVETLSISGSEAHCKLKFDIISSLEQTIRYEFGAFISDEEIALFKGKNTITKEFIVYSPKLWWCNTLNNGSSYIYSESINLYKGGSYIDSKTVKFGVRTLKLVNNIVKQGEDESFYFELNGVNVFVRGANFIPSDSFVSRSEANNTFYLKKMRDSYMNMVRVWGGGVYQSDQFYSTCDEYGIMVWQDFMFACAMYPAYSEIAQSIAEEAEYNVKRIRSHPSLALWAGNNEIWVGYNEWSWTEGGVNYSSWKDYDTKHGDYMYYDYTTIFNNILPNVVSLFDPTRTYWPSTPSSSIYKDKYGLNMGDIHYWEVWGNTKAVPITNYFKYVGRFISEYGFQSYPAYSTLKSVIPEAHLSPEDPYMLNHQKAVGGNKKLTEYMLNELGEAPADFFTYIYYTQIVQAYALETAITAHRLGKNRTMGTMFWQINDCWPVISWATIDYYGKEKLAHYTVKRMYQPIVILAKEEGNYLLASIVNDYTQNVSVNYLVQSCTIKGACSDYKSGTVEVSHYSPLQIGNYSISSIAKKGKMSTAIKMIIWQNGDAEKQIKYHFFRPTYMYEDNSVFKVEQNVSRTEVSMKFDVTGTVRNLYIYCEVAGEFSDNNLDIVNDVKTVKFTSPNAMQANCKWVVYKAIQKDTSSWLMIVVLVVVGIFSALLIFSIAMLFCK